MREAMTGLGHIRSAVIVFLTLVVSGTAVAQGEAVTADSSTDSKRLTLPYWWYETDESEWLRQAGTFYGSAGLGLEYTMRPPATHFYSSIFVGSLPGPDNSTNVYMLGLTGGYETLLHATRPAYSNRANVLKVGLDGTQFYARIGPGIGMGGVARVDEDFELYPVIYTSTSIGALTTLGRYGTVFVELGGRLGWFPTLEEMHFVGGPHLSIGFLIFSPKKIPLYQY